MPTVQTSRITKMGSRLSHESCALISRLVARYNIRYYSPQKTEGTNSPELECLVGGGARNKVFPCTLGRLIANDFTNALAVKRKKKKNSLNIVTSSLESVQHFKYITLLWSHVYLSQSQRGWKLNS